MDHDAAACDRGGRIRIVVGPHLVVVDNRTGGFVPDLDPELVLTASAILLPINGG